MVPAPVDPALITRRGCACGCRLVAAGLRVWAPWDDVFGAARVNFLETDAWYHVRLVENQVRNFPHRVTVDPYAAPDGQYVAVAPLLDTIIATAVFVTQGRDATAAYIERVAALVPADRRRARGGGGVGARHDRVRSPRRADRRLARGHPARAFPRSHAGRLRRSPRARSVAVVRDARGARACRQVLARRRSSLAAPASASGLYLLAWASGAYFVCDPGGLDRAGRARRAAPRAPIAHGEQHRDHGGDRAGRSCWCSRIPRLFRYNTQIASLAGLLAAVAGGDVLRVIASAIALGRAGGAGDRDRRRRLDVCAGARATGASPISIASVPIPRAWRCSRRGRCFSTPATGPGRSRGCFSAAAFTSASIAVIALALAIVAIAARRSPADRVLHASPTTWPRSARTGSAITSCRRPRW